MQVAATPRCLRLAPFFLVALAVAPALAAPASIEIYLALGEPGAVHVEGRVLAGVRPPAERAADRPLLNLLRTALAVASDELSAVDVLVSIPDAPEQEAVRVTTDGEGFFEAVVPAGEAGDDRAGTLALEVRLDAAGRTADPVRVDATVVPAEGARIVVTDFDDTLASSHVTAPILFLAQAVLLNGAQVAAVPGASACLAELAGASSAVVVLSGQPVNFHPRLAAFLQSHGFPPAWFALRDFCLGPQADALDVGEFTGRELDRLPEIHPHARFVLLGDSGEQDADAYAEWAARNGGVGSIWVRRVPGWWSPNREDGRFFESWEDVECGGEGGR